MASLEFINFTEEVASVIGGKVSWSTTSSGRSISALPQLFWASGESWVEANLWALSLASSKERKSGTVRDSMASLQTYATWLEASGVDWRHFPARAADRCLVNYRGQLVVARDSRRLAPATATKKMSAAIRFYRWAAIQGLVPPVEQMWEDREVRIHHATAFGLGHTLRVTTSNMAIRNRKPEGMFKLEDGLLPVSIEDRDAILTLADKHLSEEIVLMLRCGFMTGMRLGSIADLKLKTVLQSITDAHLGIRTYEIGPTASPPVNTKFGKPGKVLVPEPFHDLLVDYCTSMRRKEREARAAREHKDLVFLTRHGKPFVDAASGTASAIGEAMNRLRAVAKSQRVTAMRGFKFHRTRATFATELMKMALNEFQNKADAINLVRTALMHKSDATTMHYVTFLEQTHAMKVVSKKFSDFFLGTGNKDG